MDFLSNAGTLALGHNHPVIVEAIKRQLDAGLPMQTLDLTTPIKDEFVAEIFSTFLERDYDLFLYFGVQTFTRRTTCRNRQI